MESGQTSGLVRDGGQEFLINLAAAEVMLQGWGALSQRLRWQETINTDAIRFGRHSQMRYLDKNLKVANFQHEYHSNLFSSLDLPILPSDRSRLNV